jgi:hypothetical protein
VTDEPLALLGALADEVRLRAFAAVLLGAATSAEVAAAASLRERDAVEALVRLEGAGLVRREAATWRAQPARLRVAVAAATPERPTIDHGAGDPNEAAVLRTFLPEGRIVQIPAHESKRRVVLDHVCRVFEPGRRYPEREVNTLLRAFTDDHVTIRRYLVDYGYLARDGGEYWRIGGSVDV